VTRRTAAIGELKAQLSRYLKRVRAGEEILVTDRGVPVARLVPVGGGDRDELRDLERQGLARVGRGVLPKNFWELPRPRDPEGRVRGAVRAEREGGW
jgi:prevent-host-death family protein